MLIACAGHWWESLLFVAPVGMVYGAMRWATWRADREVETAAPDARAAEVA